MNDDRKNDILWSRGILNGVLAWVLGLVILMIPAIVVAVQMGFELGPQADDSAEVSARISETISAMYQHNSLITGGFIIVTALLIFWRAWAVLKKATGEYTVNAMLVAAFPVFFSLLSVFTKTFELSTLLEMVVYAGASYAAVYFKR